MSERKDDWAASRATAHPRPWAPPGSRRQRAASWFGCRLYAIVAALFRRFPSPEEMQLRILFGETTAGSAGELAGGGGEGPGERRDETVDLLDSQRKGGDDAGG